MHCIILKCFIGNDLGSLLHEISQIVYSLYQPKESTKNVCKSVIKSIQI